MHRYGILFCDKEVNNVIQDSSLFNDPLLYKSYEGACKALIRKDEEIMKCLIDEVKENGIYPLIYVLPDEFKTNNNNYLYSYIKIEKNDYEQKSSDFDSKKDAIDHFEKKTFFSRCKSNYYEIEEKDGKFSYKVYEFKKSKILEYSKEFKNSYNEFKDIIQNTPSYYIRYICKPVVPIDIMNGEYYERSREIFNSVEDAKKKSRCYFDNDFVVIKEVSKGKFAYFVYNNSYIYNFSNNNDKIDQLNEISPCCP